jgi:hypothetical protein
MAFVAAKVKNELTAQIYFDELALKLKNPLIVENPFKGSLRVYKRKDDLVVSLRIEPVYPPVWWASAFFLIPCFVWPSWWLAAPGLMLLSLGFFWSPPFFFLMFFLGLRKKGYQGPIRWLSSSDVLGWLLGSD